MESLLSRYTQDTGVSPGRKEKAGRIIRHLPKTPFVYLVIFGGGKYGKEGIFHHLFNTGPDEIARLGANHSV